MLLCFVVVTASAAAPLPLFDASYEVRFGLLRGDMSIRLEQNESGYIYRTSLKTRGFASLLRSGSIDETTVLELVDGKVWPLEYTKIDTIARPNRETRYSFDHSTNRVTGVYKTRNIDESLQPGGHNRISAHVAVIYALNSQGSLPVVSVFDRARWRDYEFEVIPDQTVSTPAGEFDAVEIRYKSKTKNKSWSLYCAESLDFVPVLIIYREGSKVRSRALLTGHERIDANTDATG